jgi:mono/diheme cytochrome c family protein
MLFAQPSAESTRTGLVWDSIVKESSLTSGAQFILFTFSVTNRSTNSITIQSVEPTCGCTTVELPSLPWALAPDDNGLLKVKFDAQGKRGAFVKSVFVRTSTGPLTLTVKANLPGQTGSGNNGERARNLVDASLNRQTIFKGDCATCHVKPTVGKLGKELYLLACGICHEAESRASMVPDLKTLKVKTPPAYWEQWIRKGKLYSLMPAFEQKEHGPLTNEQIESLVKFLSSSTDFSSNLVISNEVEAKP